MPAMRVALLLALAPFALLVGPSCSDGNGTACQRYAVQCATEPPPCSDGDRVACIDGDGCSGLATCRSGSYGACVCGEGAGGQGGEGGSPDVGDAGAAGSSDGP